MAAVSDSPVGVVVGRSEALSDFGSPLSVEVDRLVDSVLEEVGGLEDASSLAASLAAGLGAVVVSSSVVVTLTVVPGADEIFVKVSCVS
jgi:hypothetical protein